MKPVDDIKVWSVVCSYVARPYRGLGLQHQMLAAAIGFARGGQARSAIGRGRSDTRSPASRPRAADAVRSCSRQISGPAPKTLHSNLYILAI